MAARRITWNDRLVSAIKADPKKAGVLIILVTVLGGLWVRIASKGKTGGSPSVALAADNLSSEGGSKSAPASAVSLAEWKKAAISPLGRNLFAAKLDYFPRDGSRPITAQRTAGDTFWDDLAKSMTSAANQRRQRQVLIENLQAQAKELRLQTIVMGAKPSAVVNGELVREGSVVASFRVLRIEARRIIIEREGIKLEILMK